MGERVAELEAFADSVADEGLDAVVLLGMGGSSLAPEVLRRTFRVESFHVLDTTHPAAIRAVEDAIDLEHTLFVSASKSGGTLETRSHTDYFWERTGKRGAAFVAITDPGSDLERMARERGFRHVFAGEPTIGGRYSALSPFGIVPAALMGVDVARLLASADRMADACRRDDGNPGYELGRQFGSGWLDGPRQDLHRRDRRRLRPLGGAADRGVDRQAREGPRARAGRVARRPGPPGRRAADRRPVLARRRVLPLGVRRRGRRRLPRDQPVRPAGRAGGEGQDERGARDRHGAGRRAARAPIDELLAQANERDYVCVQAFIEPSAENDRRIDDLVRKLRRRSGLVVTHGYGPRYLHSTGQLHKGGPNTGLFLQVVDDPGEEIPIPGKPFGFRRLLRAQAAGDYASLQERGRRAARIHIEEA